MRLIDFFESLDRESDRAVPILAFAYIDAEFSRVLRETLNPEVSGGVGALFGPLGPLGSASTRFNMAHALHWITNETAKDLHLLRRIRNRFAHELMEEGLRDSKTIDDLVGHRLLIRILEALFLQIREHFEDSELDIRVLMPLRGHLIAAAAVSAWTSLAQMYVAPVALRSGVSPASLLDPHSDSAPRAIADQHKAFKRFVDVLIVKQIDARVADILELADSEVVGEEE